MIEAEGRQTPGTPDELDELLSAPPPYVSDHLATAPGDITVIGAGGKMGTTLALMAKRATPDRKVVAVSRFGDERALSLLRHAGVETITADVLDPDALAGIPGTENMIYMLGRKFGTATDAGPTWLANVVAPQFVASHFRESRIVAFSSGNVYPMRHVAEGGADETVAPAPAGEYAWTCLGRERIFQHAALAWGTEVLIYRLNYATELRYGVLVDIANSVFTNQPVDVSMAAVNVIWQGDANAMALAALTLARSPASVLNVTGPEVIPVRWIAHEFGRRFGREPYLVGVEQGTALLNDAALACRTFGTPTVAVSTLLDWTAEWLANDRPLLGKPTHFESRQGAY